MGRRANPGRAGAVELRGAVAGLTEQHDPAVGEAVEQPSERGAVEVGERLGSLCDHLREGLPA
jgi:hypothetical protein